MNPKPGHPEKQHLPELNQLFQPSPAEPSPQPEPSPEARALRHEPRFRVGSRSKAFPGAAKAFLGLPWAPLSLLGSSRAKLRRATRSRAEPPETSLACRLAGLLAGFCWLAPAGSGCSLEAAGLSAPEFAPSSAARCTRSPSSGRRRLRLLKPYRARARWPGKAESQATRSSMVDLQRH